MAGVTLRMTWVDLAFLHWPVPVAALRSLLPPELELDTFEGGGWVAVTPFEMRGVRVRAMLPVPTARDFPELNVRTYVRYGDKGGVFFFSLDAASRLAVMGARAATGLPYYNARMRVRREKDEIRYESKRTHPDAPLADFRARYHPTGAVYRSLPGSFDHWCTERYSLFAASSMRGLLRLDVEHEPWPLQPAVADVERNTMAAAAGIDLPDQKPHVLFSRQLEVVAHWPVPAD